MSEPRVSVIIPAYHSGGRIGACLDALARQTLTDFEVVVVNSSPEEVTRGEVSRHAPTATFIQSAERLLPHAARNLGVTRARGALLVFTDPDCVAAPDWLAQLTMACESHAGAAGGSIAPAAAAGGLALGMHFCKFLFQAPGLPAGPTRTLPTASACYTRALWERIGPFDGARFCGDSLLSAKAADAGATPFFEPRAVVAHHGTTTFARFLAERLERGREFAGTRTGGASRARNALRALWTFVMLAPFLCRVLIAAVRAGELARVLGTFPVQLAGQLAWRIGESAGYLAAVSR